MRVFVTGATGWIGSAVVKELIEAGHQVLGLARSDQGADALAAAGAEVQRGSLEDLDSIRRGAEQSDGVIHTAFNHDFSKFAENAAHELRVIDTIGAVLEGSGRAFVATSGIALLAPGGIATEQTPAREPSASFPRNPEGAIARLSARGVRATVVRLPPSVHGHGDRGFIPRIVGLARDKGVSPYIGDGLNRWPAVHRVDAARVFRLAFEHRAEQGPFHAVADEGVPFKAIAEVIGRRLDVPVVSLSPQEAHAHFGWLAAFVGTDCPATSERTRAALGWQPQQPGLIADIDHPAYMGR
ncbi:SDR family oxidoreductase [Burkholderia singularis]|uniref:Nucleoside-diphosphate-sugar epimerases n=1 Tax=Burkholderia singularis TaxID=1503053 RepID=A0A238HBW8_9BURK|nr:SDR family oxidoreductase [Burkholderia singularis]SMG02779.1 Nucleoside-diphosphate-sugar epimerases [Burkholderia singularis]